MELPLDATPALPRPSNAYWPPGPALFAAAGGLLLPDSLPLWRRAQALPVLGAALLVAGTFVMARRLRAPHPRRAAAPRLRRYPCTHGPQPTWRRRSSWAAGSTSPTGSPPTPSPPSPSPPEAPSGWPSRPTSACRR